jgi:flagellar biosynthesis anti-sigma factor FlgM
MIDKVQLNFPAGYATNVNHSERNPGIIDEKSHQFDADSAEVNLSANALAMHQIRQAVNETPDVRGDVVQNIQARLEAGTYQIDVERLAENLLPLFKPTGSP